MYVCNILHKLDMIYHIENPFRGRSRTLTYTSYTQIPEIPAVKI